MSYIKNIFFGNKSVNVDKINDSQEFLSKNKKWPLKLSGEFFLIDCGSIEDELYAYWAIGSFKIDNYISEILIEFKGDILKKSGVEIDFELPDKVDIWINHPIEQYYQVVKLGKI